MDSPSLGIHRLACCSLPRSSALRNFPPCLHVSLCDLCMSCAVTRISDLSRRNWPVAGVLVLGPDSPAPFLHAPWGFCLRSLSNVSGWVGQPVIVCSLRFLLPFSVAVSVCCMKLLGWGWELCLWRAGVGHHHFLIWHSEFGNLKWCPCKSRLVSLAWECLEEWWEKNFAAF